MELYNLVCARFTALPAVDWRALAVQARDEPWRAGFIVTLMLLSTLLPTLLHLLFGVVAVGVRFLQFGYFAQKMQDEQFWVVLFVVYLYFLTFAVLFAGGLVYDFVSGLWRLNISVWLYDKVMWVYSGGWHYGVSGVIVLGLAVLGFWPLREKSA